MKDERGDETGKLYKITKKNYRDIKIFVENV